MRYFFLTFAIIAVLFVGMMGFRGQKFHKPPVQVFPDMDDQDKLKAQEPSVFFADREGGRLPVSNTQPRGFNQEGEASIGGIPEYEFGGEAGYFHTGHIGDYYGSGMPEELELDLVSSVGLIERGAERYGIYCAICHGESGDGLGITAKYGVPGIANFHIDVYKEPTYPNGRMFEVITHGKGQMGAYGANIPVRDRWAIIAYVRTLQAAKVTPTEDEVPVTEPTEGAPSAPEEGNDSTPNQEEAPIKPPVEESDSSESTDDPSILPENIDPIDTESAPIEEAAEADEPFHP